VNVHIKDLRELLDMNNPQNMKVLVRMTLS